MTAAAAAGRAAAETGGAAAVAGGAEAVVPAAVGGVTAGGDGEGGDDDGSVGVGDGGGAASGGGGDGAGEADVAAGVRAVASAGGGDALAAAAGGRDAGTSTLARGGVVTLPAASLPGSCESGRGIRGGADVGVLVGPVGSDRIDGSDLTAGSDTRGPDRAGGSARAIRSGWTGTGGGFSGIAAVGCEGSTVGSGTFGDGEGGTDVTGGVTGDVPPLPTGDEVTAAIGTDSGAFDCCMTTTASTVAIPATASSEAGWTRYRERGGTEGPGGTEGRFGAGARSGAGAPFGSAKTSERNASSGSPELSRALRRGSLPGSGANASIASDSVR